MKLNASEINSADALIDHLIERIDHFASLGDPLRDRYIGFCAVTAAAHIETLVKEKILDFCKSQNKYLYAVFSSEFERFNGRIAYPELRTLLGRFDETADKRLARIVTKLTKLRSKAALQSADLVVAYKNLLTIRHSFSHNIDATYPHVASTDLRNYIAASKRIASAFFRCMPR